MAKKSKKPVYNRDLGILLTSREGRAILWRTLEDSGIFRSVFSTDIAIMAFNEGQRNVGLKLLTEMQVADIDAFMIMWKENYAGTSINSTSSDNATSSDDPASGNTASDASSRNATSGEYDPYAIPDGNTEGGDTKN